MVVQKIGQDSDEQRVLVAKRVQNFENWEMLAGVNVSDMLRKLRIARLSYQILFQELTDDLKNAISVERKYHSGLRSRGNLRKGSRESLFMRDREVCTEDFERSVGLQEGFVATKHLEMYLEVQMYLKMYLRCRWEEIGFCSCSCYGCCDSGSGGFVFPERDRN